MALIPSSRLHVSSAGSAPGGLDQGEPPVAVLAGLRADLSAWFVRTVPSSTARGLVALLVTGLLWGLVVVAPETVPDASATSIVGGRFVTLGLVSFVVGRRHLSGVDWARAFRYAVAGFVGYYLLLVLAIQQAGAAPVAAVIGTTPVLYGLAGARRERLALRRLAGPLAVMLLGLGVVHVVDLRDVGLAGAQDLLVGLLMAAAATVVWIWYGIDNGAWVRSSKVPSAQWTSVVGVAAGALGAPLLLHGLTIGGGVGSNVGLWATVVVVLGVGSAWLGTVAWNAASTLLPETVVGPLLVVELLIALAYAHLWARTWPAQMTVFGYVLLVGGVVFTVTTVDRLRARVSM